MKTMILAALLFTQVAYAKTMKCVSEDNEFQIVAEVDFEAKHIATMDYFRHGVKYLSFANLGMSHTRNFFTGWRDVYDVQFVQSALYMELVFGNNGMLFGNFLPRNSVLSFENQIICEI